LVKQNFKRISALIWLIASFGSCAQKTNQVCIDPSYNESIETENPCAIHVGHPKIHFKNYTDEIIETECDSLTHLFHFIQRDDSTNYYLIGIATDRSEEEKFNAKHRAQKVIDSLVELGINSDRMTATVSYFKLPLEGEPRDWPFYPPGYGYEIGVYLEIDY
jgi:hypothetical protein